MKSVMSGISRGFVCGMALMFMAVSTPAGETKGAAEVEAPFLSHEDAAIILAKFSGLFDQYISPDAGRNECVAFLNRSGIYFGLLEVANGTEFTRDDCAKAMGQVELVLSGEAEFEHGKVRLPKGVDSWKEFCILNDVKYVEVYQSMKQLMQIAMRQLSE